MESGVRFSVSDHCLLLFQKEINSSPTLTITFNCVASMCSWSINSKMLFFVNVVKKMFILTSNSKMTSMERQQSLRSIVRHTLVHLIGSVP